MKSIIFFAVVVAVVQGQESFLPRHGLPPADPPEARAKAAFWGNIVQALDNFDSTNTQKWNMRYLENGQFFQPGGPIFIMLGAEWTIDAGWIQSGQMYEMAQIHGAYMLYTEHRYYGKSYPTSDLSSDNLKYLTVDQALADVARFIKALKVLPMLANSKVVVFGGSYGGTMAMWMRQKYPNWVHAAVSSSAPLIAKVNFEEYHRVVQRNLGSTCASIVTRGVEEALRFLSLGNVDKIQEDFRMCWPVDTNNVYDMEYFFVTMAVKIGGLVQYANAQTIPTMCNTLQNSSLPSDYDRLANFMKDPIYCKPNYNYLMSSLANTTLNTGDTRQWMYQTCSELGFFQTSWASTDLFSRTIPVDFHNRCCRDIFGAQLTAEVTASGVASLNANHGALNPQVSRVVSVHGTGDPWSAIGLSQSPDSETPVIVVPGSSHCADLTGLSTSDSPAMREAKLAVRAHIARWLQQE